MIVRRSLASMSARTVGLGLIPGGAGAVLLDVGAVIAVQRVPEDRQRHAEELEGDGALDGALAAVAGVADAGELFGFFEADLDRPAVAVALDQLGGGGVEVAGEQRELVAGRLAGVA